MEDVRINELIDAEKYEDAIELISEKYIQMYTRMLDKKKATKPENKDFYCYSTKIMNEYPETAFRINMLRKSIGSDELSYLDEIEMLKNTYKYFELNY